MLRRQPPVHSPASPLAVLAGAVATLRGDPNDRTATSVRDAIRKRFGAREVFLTDSGTTALRLAIAGAARLRRGPVALPAYGCYDLATAAEGADASVALYDLDPHTLGPNWEALASLHSVAPSAVVVAHWFGHVSDVSQAAELHPEAILIEDAAQGVGGTLNGRPLGAFGSVAILSFGRGKGTTGGGGGALLAHDERGEQIVAWARSEARRSPRGFSNVAALTAQMLLGRPSVYGLPASLPFLHLGETRYHPPREPGRMSFGATAALDRIWSAADREVETRRDHGDRLLKALRHSSWLGALRAPAGADLGFLRLPALLERGPMPAERAKAALAMGVAGGYPRPLASLQTLRSRLVSNVSLPGAEVLAAQLVTLPTHRYLTERDLSRIAAWIVGEERPDR